ncbi:unnamed protein product [Toxocara canis]|uniref:STI1 domain-containing protein n=1 Tax=Toxocara canis TaxID=6265 RepID=A0A183TWC2_TOXCA|nr:unnamed protein product [Toxocara canis]
MVRSLMKGLTEPGDVSVPWNRCRPLLLGEPVGTEGHSLAEPYVPPDCLAMQQSGTVPFSSPAKKLLEHQRAKERRHEEKELKARQERVRRAQEEHKKAAEQERAKEQAGGDGFGAGAFGPGGIPPGFEQIFKDPEILSLLKDESVMAAYADIMKNPANMAKHMGNPKVLKLFERLGGITGAFPAGMTPPTASTFQNILL